jgi:hypothetical protein
MTWLNVIYHIECESLTVSIGASNCINRNNSHGRTNNLIRVKGANAMSLGVQEPLLGERLALSLRAPKAPIFVTVHAGHVLLRQPGHLAFLISKQTNIRIPDSFNLLTGVCSSAVVYQQCLLLCPR